MFGVVILLLSSLLRDADAFKFLCYSPNFGSSHSNFMGKISDALIDAGHDVVMLTPIFDDSIWTGSKKARIIEVPQCEESRKLQDSMHSDDGLIDTLWTSDQDPKEIMDAFMEFFDPIIAQCNATIHHPGLIERLREEKFDAAFVEFDDCGYGLFQLLGIDKYASTQSTSYVENDFVLTQAPAAPAYVPCVWPGHHGERMTFWERIQNLQTKMYLRYRAGYLIIRMGDVFRRINPSFPEIEELKKNVSYVFLNSEPLTDFPRPITSKVIDIGGIVVPQKHLPLNQTWSSIMDLRPRTVLLSFGTFVQAYRMPAAYKETIRATIRQFPDTTFIWKYEKPYHNISRGIPNLIETTWVPQTDMLRDTRLTAFITHCGQGSTTEANTAGVPLLVIPVAADQVRNAQQVKRNGVGVVLKKTSLSSVGPLEAALRELLSNPSYRANAARMARMLVNRPFPMRDTFVRHMEFLAEFGPLRQLDHYGARLNTLQYYSIDIVAFLVTCVVLLILVTVAALKCVLGDVIQIAKKKIE